MGLSRLSLRFVLPVVILASAVATGCGGSDSNELRDPVTESDSGTGGGTSTTDAGTGVDAAGQDGGTVISSSCTSDADCGAGLRCHPIAETCVECAFPEHCAAGALCEAGTCVPVTSCDNSLDCTGVAGRPICDPGAQACVECIGSADCPPNNDCIDSACSPYTPCENSLDCGLAGVCDASVGRCVECVAHPDCGDGRLCLGNSCWLACDSDLTCTPVGLLCDFGRGVCVQCVQHADCPEATFCSSGACIIDVCVAGSSGCEGNTPAQCDADGSGFTPLTPCASRQTCVAAAGSASCQDWVCTAGATECQGTVRVQCAADGLSVASSTDCAATGQLCVSGQCFTQACQPDALICGPDGIHRCLADGLSSTLLQSCQSTEYCDDADGNAVCRPKICAPGQPACDGNRATTCNSMGSGFNPGGTVCDAATQSCSGGGCMARVCSPGPARCVGSNVMQCSPDGLVDSVIDSCTSNEYCDAVTATCRTLLCTPNQPACDANVATTCNALGSGYLPGGTSCDPQVCVSGACRDLICAPNERRCEAGTVLACSADGLSESVVDTCTSLEFCDAPSASCQPVLCQPNQPACDGNVATTCNTDGSGYTGSRTDCTMTAQSCNAGVCTTCPGGFGAIADVRLDELSIGTRDFVALRNRNAGGCSANLAGLTLVLLDSDTVFYGEVLPLPSRTLAAGGVVYVVENTSSLPDEIPTGGNIGFSGSRGGWVALCAGSCTLSNLSNAIDLIAFNTPPAIPAPVTFTSSLTLITSTNQSTASYHRNAVTGTFPSFVSADWTTGAPSR